MNRVIFLVWFLPLIFMGIAFYVLLRSDAPLAAKMVFTALPLAIWLLGGFAIYREYREKELEHRKEDEVLKEAKRILNAKSHHSTRH